MAKCYKLNSEEQKRWDEIQSLPDHERRSAEIEFVNRIMGRDNPESFPREDMDIPEDIPRISPIHLPEHEYSKIPNFDDFQSIVNSMYKTLDEHPELESKLYVPKDFKRYETLAYAAWQSSTEEDRKSALKENRINIGLYNTNWEDLPMSVRQRLTFYNIPDRSLTMGTNLFTKAGYELWDMEEFFEFLEEKTMKPFTEIEMRIEMKASLAEYNKSIISQLLNISVPNFQAMRANKQTLERVAQLINSRNVAKDIEAQIQPPENLTADEIALADAIEDIYKEFRPMVRFVKAVLRTDNTFNSFKSVFPDAVEEHKESELMQAWKLKTERDYDGLYNFLTRVDWGVIGSGYDPRFISNQGLRLHRTGIGFARGSSILNQREEVAYNEEGMTKDLIGRLFSYIDSILTQFYLASDLNDLDTMWNDAKPKFKQDSVGFVEDGIRAWLDRVQHMHLKFTNIDRVVRALTIESMKSIFVQPYLSLRNYLQAAALHPDRSELVKYHYELPADEREQALNFHNVYVSQMGGIRKDLLHEGDETWSPFNKLNRLAEALTFYDVSDYTPRLDSFLASYNKAARATEEFLKDGDLDKWVKNSGAIHLRLTEINHAITYYLYQPDKVINLASGGIQNIKGSDMASLYVAKRITDITNFKMKRYSRGIAEMGVTGSTLWNLTVYPRGYAKRIYSNYEKIKHLFDRDTPWDQARDGFNDVLKIIVAGQILGALWSTLTGKKDNPWDIFNILAGWEFGGLFIGVAQEATNLITNIATIISPNSTDKEKSMAMAEIPTTLTSNFQYLVPMYIVAINILEALTNTGNIDKWAVRKLREILDQVANSLDKNYTAPELDKMNRSLWESIQKLLFNTEIVDPTVFERSRQNVIDAETQLGTIDDQGKFYTLDKFATVMETTMKTIPYDLITADNGFSDLAIFYKDCSLNWAEYDQLLSEEEKKAWRKSHVREEATMIFWGKVNKTVFSRGSKSGKEISNLLYMWSEQYGITEAMRKGVDWSDLEPVTITTE